jgi:biopolymer transport protein ExbD
LTIKQDLTLSVGNDSISPSQLGRVLDQATQDDRQKRIFLRADKTVPYGELMRVMNLLRAAGYLKVALVGLEGVGVDNSVIAPLPEMPAQTPLPTAPVAKEGGQ